MLTPYRKPIETRRLLTVYNDHDNELVKNNLTKLDSNTVKRDLTTGNEFSTEKHIDESTGENTIV